MSAFRKVFIVQFDKMFICSKVTICMNGMHSAKKIRENYPDMREDVMRQIYTGTFKSKKQARDRTLVRKMKTRVYDDFVARTSMGISILGCRYMGRKCTRDWVPRYTRYGRCFTFNPDGDGRVPEKVSSAQTVGLFYTFFILFASYQFRRLCRNRLCLPFELFALFEFSCLKRAAAKSLLPC